MPWAWSPEPQKLGMAVHAYNPSTWEVKKGGSGVKSQPWLHEFLFQNKTKQNIYRYLKKQDSPSEDRRGQEECRSHSEGLWSHSSAWLTTASLPLETAAYPSAVHLWWYSAAAPPGSQSDVVPRSSAAPRCSGSPETGWGGSLRAGREKGMVPSEL